MKSSIILMILMVVLVSGIACSNHKDPILPENLDIKISEESILPITETISEVNPELMLNRNVMGAWKVIVDTNSLSAEIVLARNASAIGDIYDTDLSQFLLVSPCHNCMRITKFGIDRYEDFLITFGIKHPFGDITRRPDLHGFDVRAIFIIENESIEDYPLIQVTNPDGSTSNAMFDNNVGYCGSRSPGGLLNADGYTSHYDWVPQDTRYFVNGSIITGNLNPFLRFFDDFTTGTFNPHDPAGYNVMPVGSGFKERTAVISKYNANGPLFEFYIVADVAYGHSAVLANRPNPQYYLPSFNRTEAWRAEYWIENNNLMPYDASSTADLVVQVFDWQHGGSVETEYPNPENLGGLGQSSNVLRLELSIPGFQDSKIVTSTPESGTGTPQDPLQYRMTVTNQNTNGVGQMGLLAIIDELHGQEQPAGRLAVPQAPSGFPYDTLDIRDYTLYLPVIINIKNPVIMFTNYGSHIRGELFFSYDELFTTTYPWDYTVISPHFFMDPSHRKFQYRWDYDYDGVTFDEDGAGLPSPNIFFSEAGKHNVGLRVRTNTKPPQEYIYQLPVYAFGEVYKNISPSARPSTDYTSTSRNHSVARSLDGRYYIAHTRKRLDDREVYLSIVSPDGNISTVRMSKTSNVSTEPSVTLIEVGPHAGVYVAYIELSSTNSYVYVNQVNLDGTGFDPSNAKRVSTPHDVNEFMPVITYYDQTDKLHLYYMNSAFLYSQINSVTSDDGGATWINHGLAADNGSTLQAFQTIATTWSGIEMVWSDAIDFSNRGYDLYKAQSIDGITFTDIQNISNEPGLINEVYPSMTKNGNRTLIAYLSQPVSGSGNSKIIVKAINVSPYAVEDIVVANKDSNHTLGYPVVACAADKRFIVGWSEKNNTTNNLTLIAHDFYKSGTNTHWSMNSMHNVNMGSVHTDIQRINPVLFASSPQPFVVESLFAWTDYSDGWTSENNPIQFLGDLAISSHASYKEEYQDY